MGRDVDCEGRLVCATSDREGDGKKGRRGVMSSVSKSTGRVDNVCSTCRAVGICSGNAMT